MMPKKQAVISLCLLLAAAAALFLLLRPGNAPSVGGPPGGAGARAGRGGKQRGGGPAAPRRRAPRAAAGAGGGAGRPGPPRGGGATPVGTATLTVSCENLLGDDRADDGLRAAVPDDGLLVPPTEVTVLEGDTAFTLLERVCAERGLALDEQRGLSGVYVQGIGGVREFDCGSISCWLFRINGEIRSTDSGSVVLQDGDVLEFLYTCELGADIR